MTEWKQLRGYWCRYAECCFAMWVTREGSWVGSAAREDIETVGKVAEIFERLERKDARACSWMMAVDRLLQWHCVTWPYPISLA